MRRRNIKEVTIETYRELDDGTEQTLTTLVELSVERRPRQADRVTSVDFDGDDAYDADGKAYPMTDDEKEAVAIAADDARRDLQARLDDAAEAAAEDAWEAARDR